MAPTLLVLPKWRSGMRLTGLAHPILLAGARESQSALSGVVLDFSVAPVSHIPVPYFDFEYREFFGTQLTARFYVAQVFKGDGCKPIIGRKGTMVLGRCALPIGDGERFVYVLSDPDLLNNHGLRLGDNAEIARDFISDIAGEKRVIVDYSRDNWLVEESTYDHPDRTWADLARFFGPPFTLIWLGAALTMGLFLWRGGLRDGPLAGGSTVLGASKSVMIGARSRLMRLTGQDGALVKEYAAARISVLAHRLLGPNQSGQDEVALLRFAERRDPALKVALENVFQRIRALPDNLMAEAAIEHVDELETLLEQLTDDT